MCVHYCYRLWIRFHPSRPVPASASPGWIGDDIYLAVILFGVGGTAISVVGLTLLSLLVGENTVSCGNHAYKLTVISHIYDIIQLLAITVFGGGGEGGLCAPSCNS